MSLTVRIDNRDIDPIECEVVVRQNRVGDIDCVVPVMALLRDGETDTDLRQRLRNQPIAVYQENSLLRSGIIKEIIPAVIGKYDGYYRVKGNDEFARLVNVWSKPDAHYQAVLLTSALSDLLTLANGWSLGDTSTLVDPSVTVTINVRSKQRLWAQIVDVCESVPNVFIRYGGIDGVTGDYLLDVGLFGEEDNTRYALEGYNVFSVKSKRTAQDIISKIRPKGGKAGDQIIKLTGAETEQAGYSIELDATTGEYVVSNDAITNGALVARTYSQIKTANNEPPTGAEIQEAQQALYDITVRDLQGAIETETLAFELTLTTLPLIGQKILVQSTAQTDYWNSLTQRYIQRDTRLVNDFYRITEIKFDYQDYAGVAPEFDNVTFDISYDGVMCELEVTDALDKPAFDELTFLQKQITDRDDSDEPIGAGIGLGGAYVIVVNQNNVASDCISGLQNRRLFQFDFDPPVTANIREVTYEVVEVTNNAVYNITQEADTTQPLILCVSGENDTDWTAADDVTITVRYTYFT